MKYSFIIPVYNCRGYLEACVECILTAGVSDFEILLVDDGSTDGSGALCDALAQNYAQVRVIHQSNSGASAARNRGVQEARGKYILFADADDTLDAEALSSILADPRCLAADMTIFGMSFDYYYHGKCYRRDPLFFDFDGVMTPEQWGSRFCEMYLKNSLSPLWNKVFRRELLKDLELNRDMFLYEDLEFVLRYMQRCKTVFNAHKVVYRYRQSEDEGNAKRRLKRIDSIPAFLLPIENALTQLCAENLAIAKQTADSVLLSLHIVLAREKISVSNLQGIRQICREFAAWSREKEMPEAKENDKLHHRLLAGKACTLLLLDKKSALRHRIAVWAKASGLYR